MGAKVRLGRNCTVPPISVPDHAQGQDTTRLRHIGRRAGDRHRRHGVNCRFHMHTLREDRHEATAEGGGRPIRGGRKVYLSPKPVGSLWVHPKRTGLINGHRH